MQAGERFERLRLASMLLPATVFASGYIKKAMGASAVETLGFFEFLPAGFALTYGVHFRRITRLSPDIELESGDVFVPPAGEDIEDVKLPTVKKWEDQKFFGFSVDVRAMVKLFTAAKGGK